MERSGSQKALFVLSVITIVVGCIGVILALLTILGGVGIKLLSPEELAQAGLSTKGAGKATAALTALSIVTFISSAVSLLAGVLGIRASKDNTKILPVWIIALISLIFSIISIVIAIINGITPGSVVSLVIDIVWSAIFFAVANNIKMQASR